MIFKSRLAVDIPEKDVLSYVFDDPERDWSKPLYIDAEDTSQVITGSDLLTLTKKIGRGLRDSAGVGAGDIVLTCSSNSIVTPALFLGIICAGASFSGGSPTFTTEELSYLIKDCEAKAIFADENTLDAILTCCNTLGIPKRRIHLLTLEKGPKHGVCTLGNLLEFGELEWERITSKEDLEKRIVALNYSSGTTGLPKGCEISAYNAVAHCEQFLASRDHGRDKLQCEKGTVFPKSEVMVVFVPFYHAMGQQMYCVNSVKHGDITYVMKSFDLEKLLHYIPKYRVSMITCVPPVAVGFAKHPLVKKTDFSSVHTIYCGAAPLGVETQIQAERAIDPNRRVKIQQVWGMSEAVMAVTLFSLGEYDPELTGVGHLLANMQAKLVNDAGREVRYDEPGEVLLKGPSVFRRYWKKEQATKDAFTPDGFYRTGDIGIIKKTGLLYIVDRKKELIKVNAYQVAPAELEDLLMKNPDVLDAAVIGIPGEGTERPRAYIVRSKPEVDAQAIMDFVALRVAKYKRLTGGVVFVDSIPKNPSGKILRRELRERVKKEIQNSATIAKL